MNLSKQILTAFSLILILSVIDTISNYLLSLKVKQNSEFFTKSQDIIRNSGRLHKTMIAMESSFRGYLLAQDSSFLVNYYKGIDDVPVIFSEQNKLIENNAAQKSILHAIMDLHMQWLSYSNTMMNARRDTILSSLHDSSYASLFDSKFKKQYGKKLNDEVAGKFLEFDKIEYEARATHGENLALSIKRTHTFSIIFFILTIVIGITSTAYIVSLISKRIKTMVTLAEKISQGNFTILNDRHNDELTGLSTSLNVMSTTLNKNITELERRNAELDKFTYVVSHDLKAPLRGMHNVIRWIEEDLENELSPEMRRYLTIIPERIQRMENLINGLLEYAKIRKKTNNEKVDVGEMVNEIVDSIVPRSYKVKISNLPKIFTERLKLEQVFTNLISNAVKYTSGENGEISIDSVEMPNYYEFSVKDNGSGIEAEYHEKIFEIFQTLREKGQNESTGIGLAIVKKILDDEHCSIHVKSALGQGSIFTFTWPKIVNHERI